MVRKITTPKAVTALSQALNVPEGRLRVSAIEMRKHKDELLPRGPAGRGAPELQPYHIARLLLAVLLDPKNPHDAPENVAYFGLLPLCEITRAEDAPDFFGELGFGIGATLETVLASVLSGIGREEQDFLSAYRAAERDLEDKLKALRLEVRFSHLEAIFTAFGVEYRFSRYPSERREQVADTTAIFEPVERSAAIETGVFFHCAEVFAEAREQ
ncbi:hypothetical protein [Glycocaulis alkaliphilus]|uniref:hypothetical protein n=1 Tax=Glycocaulis alkaliphilus TaxID=1434191 RepID=UPI000FD9E724|nr:hypothetical protein [Glycocaulis alkaliphilus]GGB70664.1 hypothetical protein GCM10007417_08070 [Glycocaulis alkaliphilus]